MKPYWKKLALCCVGMVLLIAAGCGTPDAASVADKLQQRLDSLKSYKAGGTMILRTGEEPIRYKVEVWHRKENDYRVALTNEKKDVTQIVLRNKEGVFVLTPHLKKSFRFQSDWPGKKGQVYLYHSLVENIINDPERKFTVDDTNAAYVFDVKAEYKNSALARQRIWLNQKTYAPMKAEFVDPAGNTVVLLEFSEFEFNPKFGEDDFDMDRNMLSWNLQAVPETLPTNAKQQDGEAATANPTANHFGVIEPSYQPSGVELTDTESLQLGEVSAVLLRYAGDYEYTLLENRAEAKHVTARVAQLIDLGFTQGVLTGDGVQTLHWTVQGVDFRLTTQNLPLDEMVKVAQSVQGQIGK